MSKAISLRLPDELQEEVEKKARLHHRSFSKQIEKYVTDGLILEDNPDLSLSFVSDIKEAVYEIKAGKGVPYKVGRH
ncbi:MAG: Arc family DNA-binding protein [Deltaproteobacteria bacterium]|nr:Arc family DNA-binding protein [Deltaproteobacteria bacterium]